jgi:hypothetical protein
MDTDAKIKILARILIEKHGRNAAEIARERAESANRDMDYPAVRIWTIAAETIQAMLGTAERPRHTTRQLDEMKDDPVTAAVMEADNISRDELDAVWATAKRRFDETDE